jgi:hypothetical protein
MAPAAKISYDMTYTVQDSAFDAIMVVFAFLYAATMFGVSESAPRYMYILDAIIKLYIGAFLMWRFNPYRTVKFTELDIKIAYNSGLVTLASTVVYVFGPKYWWVTAVLTIFPMIFNFIFPPKK